MERWPPGPAPSLPLPARSLGRQPRSPLSLRAAVILSNSAWETAIRANKQTPDPCSPESPSQPCSPPCHPAPPPPPKQGRAPPKQGRAERAEKPSEPQFCPLGSGDRMGPQTVPTCLSCSIGLDGLPLKSASFPRVWRHQPAPSSLWSPCLLSPQPSLPLLCLKFKVTVCDEVGGVFQVEQGPAGRRDGML